MNKSKTYFRIFLITFSIAVSLLLVGCKTCTTVQVPYDSVENYQVDMKFEQSGSKGTTLHGLDVWAYGNVNIRNVDSETGAFTVAQTFTTLNRPSQTLTSTQYVMPGETKTFHQEYDINLGEDFNMNYVVTPAQKTLTRTVTLYRDEQQCN